MPTVCSGGGSPIHEGQLDSAENYKERGLCCRDAERIRTQWEVQGGFDSGSLSHYSVRGSGALIPSFNYARSLGASFGTFDLGFRTGAECAGSDVHNTKGIHEIQLAAEIEGIFAHSRQEIEDEKDACGARRPCFSLLGSIICNAFADSDTYQRVAADNSGSSKGELSQLWNAMQKPSSWARSMCGVVTVQNWSTAAQRNRIRQQLQLASFMCLYAVEVPLPLSREGVEPQSNPKIGEMNTSNRHGQIPPAACDWALLGYAADSLVSFIQASNGGKVWVRCDACRPEHLEQYHRLHHLVLYGCERDPITKETIGPRQDITAATATEAACREAIANLSPMLYFSSLQDIPSVWLGEDVSVFEPPSAELLIQLSHPTQGGDGVQRNPPREWGAEAFESSKHQCGYSNDIFDSSAGSSGDTCCAIESCEKEGEAAHVTPSQQGAYLFTCCVESRAATQLGLRYGLLPKEEARWGGLYPQCVPLVTFIVELMRRRVVPLFSTAFFDQYAVLNLLHSKTVVDPTRDFFVDYEDTLQLPLQPLAHPLPNIVYEIFERDSIKYSRYRDALSLFFRDWVDRDPATSHHGPLNKVFVSTLTGPGGDHDVASRENEADQEAKIVYVVLLGCGRGGIVGEILSAASSMGLRLRLFAIEKNAPAAELTQLRWLCDLEWRRLAAAFDHSFEVIVADARRLFEEFVVTEFRQLPDDFGLCDLLVSELLGSFGDNELSPECIEAFHYQLRCLQAAKGIIPNENLVSIPQSYTTWVAPLHSTRIEQSVLNAAIRGLTVRPEYCNNRHTALFFSPTVSNLTRGVLLAAPQACWTFSHFLPIGLEKDCDDIGKGTKTDKGGLSGKGLFERCCTLRFIVAKHARCSGMAGFFSCVLYRSEVDGKEACLSTEPRSRTPGMYSWFPGFLPIDPAHQLLASHEASTVSEIIFRFHRCVDEGKRVWYSWGLGYDRERDQAADYGPDHKRASENSTISLFNEKGWAASMLM